MTRALAAMAALWVASAAGAQPLPRHGSVMFSNLCVSERSGDVYGMRLTLRRIGDVDDVVLEIESEPPRRVWPVDVKDESLSFSMPNPYSGAAVVARLVRHGEALQLVGPVLNADSSDRIELHRVTDFRRRLPHC